jgi:autotransporter strand-loop-strand O-heptosyltransferase
MYKNLKKVIRINDVDQVENEVQQYERFFQVEKNDVILDIGSHIGAFTKKHLKKAKKIYAIEPDPIFIKEYPKSKKLILNQVGISDYTGSAKIVSDGNANVVNDFEGVEIKVTTFKEIVKKTGKVDFLKVDCEGGEYHIFTKDNIDWISNNVKKIAGEFHLHTEEQRLLLPYIMYLFRKAGFSTIYTAIDGTVISEEQIKSRVNYYTEILFYCLTNDKIQTQKPEVLINYVKGCRVELRNGVGDYDVKFIDNSNSKVMYETKINGNSWAKCNFEYFIPWRVEVSQDGNIIENAILNLKDSRVLITLESSSLGDTLAWFPYVEEFRKKHGCEIICSTFKNFLFEKNYPSITFVKPGEVVPNIVAQYCLGWYYNGNAIDKYRNPSDPKRQTLQRTASNILGLDYQEIRPILTLPNPKKEDRVTMALHSTSQAKYWNNPTGWQEVTDHINSKKHKAIMLSSEQDGFMGNMYPQGIERVDDLSLENTITELRKSKVFIGIGSGLSWLAWACNVPVILISGFSEDYTEMEDCIRISTPLHEKPTCTGCFNRYKLDAGDWNWCPLYKGTEREFECSKEIKGNSVINALNMFI